MYTMDGAIHHGGPVSSTSAWIDPSAQNAKGETPTISAKTSCVYRSSWIW